MAHGTRRGVPWSWPAVLALRLTRNCAILRWPSKGAKWGGVDLCWSWPAALAPRSARNHAMLRWPSKDAKWSGGATVQGGLEAEGPNKKNSPSSNKRGLRQKSALACQSRRSTQMSPYRRGGAQEQLTDGSPDNFKVHDHYPL